MTAVNADGKINGKLLFELTQQTSVFVQLAIVVGRMRMYKEKMGNPVLVKVQLMDQQQTVAAVSGDIVMEVLEKRLSALRDELENKGVDLTPVIEGIEHDLGVEQSKL